MEVNAKRSANFSKEEEYLLVSLVEKYKYIIECKKSDASTWREKENAWRMLEAEFNSGCTTNGKRNVKVLKEKYRNLKKKTKEKFSSTKTEISKTGGCKYTPPVITEIEEAVKNILGQEQVSGLQSHYDCDSDVGNTSINNTEVHQEFIIQESHDSNDSEGHLSEHSYAIVNNDVTSPAPELQMPVTLASHSVKASNSFTNDWTTYTSKNLKTPVTPKLKLNPNVKRSSTLTEMQKRKKFAGKKYTSLNTQLIQEKLDFVRLQQDKFLEKHNLKMQILKKKLERIENQ